MKTRLITGADGSLGRALTVSAISIGRKCFGLPRGDRSRAETFIELDRLAARTNLTPDEIVLNDGTNALAWIGHNREDDVRRIFDVNVMQQLWVLEWAAHRITDKPVKVLFVASQTYRVAQRTTAAYCASKAAMVQMMRVAARELAPRGWQVNAIAPGKIEDTAMSTLTDAQVLELRGWAQEEADRYAKELVPMKRFTNREEVADIVEWALAAPAYVNGSVFEAAGGV